MKKSMFSPTPRLRGGGVGLLALVLMCAFALMSCDRDAKMTAGDATSLISATPAGTQDAAGESQNPSENRGYSSVGEFGGGEQPMDGGPGGSGGGFDEEDEWDIRDFTDPRTQETYPIIDGRVLIAFKNPPEFPTVDPNYFDEEIDEYDDYYESLTYGEVGADEEVADFIAAEELIVYAEWNSIRGIAAVLPEGTSVEYAVENWPDDYPDLIESVDPDSIGQFFGWPYDAPPNDDLWIYNWNLWTSPNNQNDYDINISQVWANGFHGSAGVVVAVLDTGVQRKSTFIDLNLNLLAWGVNTGDKKASTQWGNGYGSPWMWLMEKSQANAEELGHGTCVSGIISAGINNDPFPTQSSTDFCGISPSNKVLPIAIKGSSIGYSDSAYYNALNMVACIKRIIDPRKEWGSIGSTIPYANIEVANCSFGHYKTTSLETRLLNLITPHVLVVGGAGNQGYNYSAYPGRHSNAISVAAHDNLGKRAIFQHGSSNYGNVNIAAPGALIPTTDMVGKTDSGNYWLGYIHGPPAVRDDYHAFSGTSAAAPHVSAVAALISSAYPALSPAAIKQRILQNTLDLPNGEWGLVNGLNANAALGN